MLGEISLSLMRKLKETEISNNSLQSCSQQVVSYGPDSGMVIAKSVFLPTHPLQLHYPYKAELCLPLQIMVLNFSCMAHVFWVYLSKSWGTSPSPGSFP